MAKDIKKDDEISKRHDTDIWSEIRKMHESKSRPSAEKIVEVLKLEFDIDKFPSVRTIRRRANEENWKRWEDPKKDAIAKGYSDEVWLCIKSVYESNPKIAYRVLKDKVQNELQCETFPAHQVITARAKKEDWKHSEALLSEDDRALKKLLKQSRAVNKLGQDEDEGDENSFLNHSLNNVDPEDLEIAMSLAKIEISKVKKLIVGAEKKKEELADVILHSRSSMRSLIAIGDMISDRLVEYHTVLTSQDFLKVCPYELYKQIKEEQKETIILSKEFSDMSFSRRENIKFNLSLHGVTVEDLRDKDDSAVLVAMNDETDFAEQKERLIRQREEMIRKRRYIDSGQMEDEVNAEVEKAMRDFDENSLEDVEEAEFEDID